MLLQPTILATSLLATGTTAQTPVSNSTNSTTTFAQQCASFNASRLSLNASTHFIFAEHIPANTNITLYGADPTCIAKQGASSISSGTELCRVSLATQIAPGSLATHVEVLLPEPNRWTTFGNARLLSTGNGGLDGCLDYAAMLNGAVKGFAATGSNAGHNGTSGRPFLNAPDVLEDFSHRSLHASTVLGKEVVEAFYGVPAKHSYYFGCSQGGRQGVGALLRYAGDYDGVVVGAPAVDWNHLYGTRARFEGITGAKASADFITEKMWQYLIFPEVMTQCDSIDGGLDGVIEDTDLCVFRPETLICPPSGPTYNTVHNYTTCLTQAQVDIVNLVHQPTYGTDGKLKYPRYPPGNEREASGGLLAGSPFPESADWFKYVVRSNASWDPTTFTLSDLMAADTLNPSNIRTWDGDLSAYRDRGGKLFMYHGLSDGRISPENSERYYNLVTATLKSNTSELDKWFRSFRISGMNHCRGGDGCWDIGQAYRPADDVNTRFDPDFNLMWAIVGWVEQDAAPDIIWGQAYYDGAGPGQGSGSRYNKRHCRYPYRNTKVGNDPFDGESWKCLYPDRDVICSTCDCFEDSRCSDKWLVHQKRKRSEL